MAQTRKFALVESIRLRMNMTVRDFTDYLGMNVSSYSDCHRTGKIAEYLYQSALQLRALNKPRGGAKVAPLGPLKAVGEEKRRLGEKLSSDLDDLDLGGKL